MANTSREAEHRPIWSAVVHARGTRGRGRGGVTVGREGGVVVDIVLVSILKPLLVPQMAILCIHLLDPVRTFTVLMKRIVDCFFLLYHPQAGNDAACCSCNMLPADHHRTGYGGCRDVISVTHKNTGGEQFRQTGERNERTNKRTNERTNVISEVM